MRLSLIARAAARIAASGAGRKTLGSAPVAVNITSPDRAQMRASGADGRSLPLTVTSIASCTLAMPGPIMRKPSESSFAVVVAASREQRAQLDRKLERHKVGTPRPVSQTRADPCRNALDLIRIPRRDDERVRIRANKFLKAAALLRLHHCDGLLRNRT